LKKMLMRRLPNWFVMLHGTGDAARVALVFLGDDRGNVALGESS